MFNECIHVTEVPKSEGICSEFERNEDMHKATCIG